MKKPIFSSIIILTLTVTLRMGYGLEESVDLEKIVVTPYRTAVMSEPSDSSTEHIIISEEERKGVLFLKQVLDVSSSIVEASSGSLGGETSVFLRGHNSSHTRFMLDGIKIYDPMLTAAYYSFSHFNLQGVQKIEISKGPQSSLYGSDAIGGVINLFTQRGRGKPKLTFGQKIGSFQTYEESLDFSGELDRLGYYLGVVRTDTNGYSLAKESNANHEKDPYHNLNASLRLDYDVSEKTSLSLIGRYIYAKYEYDGSSWVEPYLPTDDDDNYAYDEQQFYGLTLNQNITEHLDYKLLLASTHLSRRGWEDASTDNWYNGRTYQLDQQFNLRLLEFYKIIFGFDYLREIGDSYRVDDFFGFIMVSDFPKSTAHNKGYFVENILNPGENLLCSFSYRRDEHSSFGSQDTCRVAAGYLFDPLKTNFKASFGTGFKAPSLYQLYAPPVIFVGPIGNSQLLPEESRTYEFGFDSNIIKKCKLNVVYFHTGLENLIDFSSDGYININKARIKGVESALRYYFTENLILGLRHTWLDTENKSNGAELGRRPANKVVFDAQAKLGKLGISFNIAYVGHRYSDMAGTELLKPYILGNLSIDYLLKDNLNIYCRFQNIFDQDYELIRGYQTEPFAFYAGVRLEI